MFLAPFKTLREAMKALPAMRYALGISALLALLAIARSYGIDLRVAGFGSLVFFVLLIPILLFSQLAESTNKPLLKYPALVLLWASVCLCIASWVCLFGSVFFHRPLDLHSWLLGGENAPSTVEISRPPPILIPSSVPKVETLRMPVVRVHVGGDDSKHGSYSYQAPAAFSIKSYKLLELTKGGDTAYAATLSNPSTLRIDWSVHSKTVRGPFKIVVNTITAFLGLDVEITIQARPNGAHVLEQEISPSIIKNNPHHMDKVHPLSLIIAAWLRIIRRSKRTWTTTGSLGTARSLHSAILLPNSKLLVASGGG